MEPDKDNAAVCENCDGVRIHGYSKRKAELGYCMTVSLFCEEHGKHVSSYDTCDKWLKCSMSPWERAALEDDGRYDHGW